MNKVIKLITAYRSSDGVIANYKFEVLPEDGYQQMCAESLAFLLDTEQDWLNKAGEHLQEMVQAINEVRESWHKVINGTNTAKEYNLDPDVKYIKNCRVISTQVIFAPESKPRKYRSKLTQFKDKIRKASPMGEYIFAFKLKPGCYKAVIDIS